LPTSGQQIDVALVVWSPKYGRFGALLTWNFIVQKDLYVLTDIKKVRGKQ
jgi:hypothetical protein